MVVAKVLKLQQHVGLPLAHCLHKIVDKGVVLVVPHAGMLKARVLRRVDELLVVCANVQADWEAVVGVHTCKRAKVAGSGLHA